MEENFWDLNPTFFPNTILTASPHSSYPIVTLDIHFNPCYGVPSITILETGGNYNQVLEPSNTELLVYTRRKLHPKNQRKSISLRIDQSQNL